MSSGQSTISYRDDYLPRVAEFIDVLQRSGLGERRPIAQPERMARMLAGYTFACTAWSEARLIGIATVWTDFAYSAYLADLAVDHAFQHRGIGEALVEQAHRRSGPETTLHLISAPAAVKFYEHIGMERVTDCFRFRRRG